MGDKEKIEREEYYRRLLDLHDEPEDKGNMRDQLFWLAVILLLIVWIMILSEYIGK